MTTVSEIMTRGVRTMSPSETVAHAAQAMHELNVGSLPVCSNNQLVGIVPLGDVATNLGAGESGGTLAEISEPSRTDRSNNSAASGDQGGGETQTFLS